jgi:hypothetical protein
MGMKKAIQASAWIVFSVGLAMCSVAKIDFFSHYSLLHQRHWYLWVVMIAIGIILWILGELAGRSCGPTPVSWTG